MLDSQYYKINWQKKLSNVLCSKEYIRGRGTRLFHTTP